MTGLGLGLAPVSKPGFSLTPRLEESTLVVKFDGNADMSAVETLSSYLKHVDREALRLGVTCVRFDFRELYFMNSSCFKSFVTWIDDVAHSRAITYKIVFLTNASLHWQRRSLEALRRLAEDIVSIEA